MLHDAIKEETNPERLIHLKSKQTNFQVSGNHLREYSRVHCELTLILSPHQPTNLACLDITL